MVIQTARGHVDVAVPISRLTLTDFRSYRETELVPAPGLTVVAGPNGTGKTNLLEAIHTAIVGRSHRAATDAELVRHGAGFARVRVELADGTAVELVIPGADAPAGVRKRLTVNGVPRRGSTVSEVARAVLFRPEEMLLLVGAPGERRRFLDGIVSQRDRRAARDLVDVARVIAQRNALLRAIRAEEAPLDALAFWDDQLASLGSRVMRARLEVLRLLMDRIGPLHAAVAPDGERAAVQLTYLDGLKEAWTDRTDPADRIPSDAELADAYRARIADVRQKEAWNGVSLVGPQRDDVRAALDGRDVATHASRGQQRTIILAMKLAETEILAADGPAPVVLLDDVFSELDPGRADRLSDLVAGRGQVLVTTADPATLEGARRRDAVVWRILDGTLRPDPR